MKKIVYFLAFLMASATAYSTTSNTSIVSGGLWSATTTWNLGTVPVSSDNVVIATDVILDDVASVNSLVVNGSCTFSDDGNWRTITISDGGSIANNGTWTATTTCLTFSGGGSFATSSQPYSIQALNLYGALTVVTSPTILEAVYVKDASVTVTGNDIVYGTNAGIEFEADHTVGSGDALWSTTTLLGTAGVRISSDKVLTINEARSCLGGIRVNGTLTLGADIEVGSNLSFGTFNHNNHKVTIKGDTDCSVSGSIAFYDFVIHTTTSTRTVVFDGSLSVANSFTFTSGRAKIVNSATLDLGSATLSGFSPSQYFISAGGSLVRTVPATTDAVDFPIGSQNGDAGALYYNPVVFTNNGGAAGAGKYGAACVYGGTFPKAVHAKWTIANIDAATPNAGIVFQWPASEEAAPYTHDANNIYVGKRTSAPVWSQTKVTVFGSDPYTVPLSGITVFGDFYIGNSGAFPTVAPSVGDGSSGSPYQITNLTDLCWMAFEPTHWSLYYIQTTDIDASEINTWFPNGSGGYYGWKPIGTNNTKFTGSYNGQNHKISNLYINRPSMSYTGFMGFVVGATISNLGITNCSIIAEGYAGCLAGDVEGSTSPDVRSVISNCYSTGTISGNSSVGGLCGNFVNSTLSSCFSRVNVTGIGTNPEKIGGLIGTNYGSYSGLPDRIENCYSTGSVTTTGGQYIGGLIGYSYGSEITITKCYSTGSISGSDYVGGLLGSGGSGTSNCFWDNQTSGTTTSSGGIGKTTEEMKTLTTFTGAGWNFTPETGDWEMIGTNYPRLRTNADPALPVEMTAFTAAVEKGNVQLNWKTATELNNFGFEVEKQSSINNWSKIGFVEGNGTTNAPKSYSFTDKSANGKTSYRLKQIDRDGKFEYSQEVEVTAATAPKEFALEQNYPNPFNPTTNISFTIPVTGHARLTVFNILGAQVCELFNGIAKAGEKQTAVFDATRLSSGIYFYRLEGAGMTEIKKMQLVR
jgi:hypothetical protein